MADNVLNAIVNHFVGDGHRLFRVAGIIIFNDLQLVTFDPTLRVNIGNRLLSTGKLRSPYWATGPDIAPTTAILISSANAALLIIKAIHPASSALPFMFILRLPIIMVLHLL